MSKITNSRLSYFLLGLAVLVPFILFTLKLSAQATQTEKNLKESEVSRLHVCNRLNILTAEQNRESYGFYKANLVITKYEKEPNSVAINLLQSVLGETVDKEWTPLTNCLQAASNVLHYSDPLPRKFSKELPPPSALTTPDYRI